MPLLAHSPLPAFARLAGEGVQVCASGSWSGPVLRVGLVNTMADGALAATERQFLRLLAAGAPGIGIEPHLCGLPQIARADVARRYCDEHYLSPAGLRAVRPDAVIITGANVADPDLDRLPYRDALADLIDWAEAEVRLSLYSCLATHAVLHFRHGRQRRALAAKRWGVFPHRIAAPGHPLAAGLRDGVPVPHSRWNDVPAADFVAAGLEVVLVDADNGDVHLAASTDGRRVFMQGHPEYDAVSLLKEHRREVARFVAGELRAWPAAPSGILDEGGAARLLRHRDALLAALRDGRPAPDYPEEALQPHLAASWRAPAAAFYAAWLARSAVG